MKPAQGLITCYRVLDLLLANKYLQMPINRALKKAQIDIYYGRDQSAYIKFHPKHSLFANSDSLEEGARQLIANYYHHVLSLLQGHDGLVVKTFGSLAIFLYLEVLRTFRSEGEIRKGENRWFPAFSVAAFNNQYGLSTQYMILDDNNLAENEKWAVEQSE